MTDADPPRVTARHVAERLGIAVSTVGRALAGDPRVSETTRLRVARVADELNYAGNRAARMLRGASSGIVGLIIPDIRNSFYSTAAHLLARELGHRGVQVLLAQTDDDPASELAHIRRLHDVRALGVVIVPTSHMATTSAALLSTTPHIQFIRRHDELNGPWAGVDDAATVAAATATLRAAGHRRIGFVGGPADSWTGARRVAGYRGEVAAAGGDDDRWIRRTDGSVGAARAALGDLLDGDEPITALVCGSVAATRAAIAELDERRIEVPAQLSVVGFTDVPGSAWWRGGMTTMDLPVPAVAERCVRWCVETVAGDAGSSSGAYEPIASRLLARATVAPPPG